MAAVFKDIPQELQDAQRREGVLPPQMTPTFQGNTAIVPYGTVVPLHAQVGGTVVGASLTGTASPATTTTVDISEAISIETDFCGWLYRQASILRYSRPSVLDWEHLAEELEDMGINLKNGLTSHLAHVFEHMLKLRYEPNLTYRANQEHRWKVDLAVHRDEVNDILDASQSLTNELDEFISKAYSRGRKYAGTAMRNLPRWQAVLPDTCPWSIDEIRDENFVPSPIESDNSPS